MLDKKPSRIGAVVSAAIVLIVAVAAGWLLLNRGYVQDQLAVWGFTPSTEVAQLTSDMALTERGKFYFYASSPRIDQANVFNSHCPQQETNNPILGCYTNQKIYVFDVTEDDLEGIVQVTAAHEMLHAIWDRHSQPEKDKLERLLRNAYTALHDKDLEERMAYYQRNEPGEFVNELHSIIGTEEASIGPELEQYYAHYFSDRQKIVGYHEQYDSVFKGLRQQADELFEELNTLGSEIDSERAAYQTAVAALERDINNFNARATSGKFSSQNDFYNERARLVVRSDELDAERSQLNEKITNYNKKYETYQTLASRIQQLNSSVDSMKSVGDVPKVGQ